MFRLQNEMLCVTFGVHTGCSKNDPFFVRLIDQFLDSFLLTESGENL